jgi:hypothetical protein
MAKQIRGVGVEVCCVDKLILGFETPETYNLFIMDYRLHPLYLKTTARTLVYVVFYCNKDKARIAQLV